MIKKVGDAGMQLKHKAIYHCGAVELEIELPDDIAAPCHCDCDCLIYPREGAVVASALQELRS
jgi:hypothetical protein